MPPKKKTSEDIDKEISDLIAKKKDIELKEKEAAKKRDALNRAKIAQASSEYAKKRAEVKSMVRQAKKTVDHICRLASRNRLTEAEIKVLEVLSKYPEKGAKAKELPKEEE